MPAVRCGLKIMVPSLEQLRMQCRIDDDDTSGDALLTLMAAAAAMRKTLSTVSCMTWSYLTPILTVWLSARTFASR
jgi:hypothetical protein